MAKHKRRKSDRQSCYDKLQSKDWYRASLNKAKSHLNSLDHDTDYTSPLNPPMSKSEAIGALLAFLAITSAIMSLVVFLPRFLN